MLQVRVKGSFRVVRHGYMEIIVTVQKSQVVEWASDVCTGRYHKHWVSEDDHGLYEDDHGEEFCVYFTKARKPGKDFEQRRHDLTYILGERQKQGGKKNLLL